MSWTYPLELYPLRLRSQSVALSTSGNWAFNMAVGLFTPRAFTNIMWKTYLMFGCFNAAMFIHVYFMFPETAGKTLEETEEVFEDPNDIKYLGTPAWKTHVKTRETIAMEHGDLEAAKAHNPGVVEEVTAAPTLTTKTAAEEPATEKTTGEEPPAGA